MSVRQLPAILLLVLAIGSAVFGGLIYFESPPRSLERTLGALLLGGAALTAVASLLLFAASRSGLASRAVGRDSAWAGTKTFLGCIVGVVFGGLLLYAAARAVVIGEFPAGRKTGSLPTRFSDSPGWFVISFLLTSGFGGGLLWLCLPPVLRAFAPDDTARDDEPS